MRTKTQNLGDRVYRVVRDAIVASELRPGQKLLHQDLTRRLGVSSTPVREALSRLAQAGYVQWVPNRGYFVNEFSPREVEDLCGVREALEVFALGASFGRRKASDLAGLERGQREYRRAVLADDMAGRLRWDREFHLHLAGLCGNQTLVQFLRQVFDQINLKRRMEGLPSERGPLAVKEHEDILEALRKGDRLRAQRALGLHLRRNRENILLQMERPATPSRLAGVR